MLRPTHEGRAKQFFFIKGTILNPGVGGIFFFFGPFLFRIICPKSCSSKVCSVHMCNLG